MKIKELLLMAALMVCVESYAFVKNFDVEAPTWKQVVVSKQSDGVNIRKLPSVSAPKLVYNEYNLDDYEAPLQYSAFWSTKPAGRTITPVKFCGPDILVREKDGWYEIKDIGPRCESNGWVSAKYCRLITPTPLSSASNLSLDTSWHDLIWLSEGTDNHNGAYGLFVELNEMEQNALFYLGRLVDGMLVCPYFLYVDFADIPGSPYSFTRTGSGEFKFVAPSYDLNLSKLKPELINKIIENMNRDDNPVVICLIEDDLKIFGY